MGARIRCDFAKVSGLPDMPLAPRPVSCACHRADCRFPLTVSDAMWPASGAEPRSGEGGTQIAASACGESEIASRDPGTSEADAGKIKGNPRCKGRSMRTPVAGRRASRQPLLLLLELTQMGRGNGD